MLKIKKNQIAQNLAYAIFALDNVLKNVQGQMPVELLTNCKSRLIDVAELMGEKTLSTTYDYLYDLSKRTQHNRNSKE